jgi:hypothetical protein
VRFPAVRRLRSTLVGCAFVFALCIWQPGGGLAAGARSSSDLCSQSVQKAINALPHLGAAKCDSLGSKPNNGCAVSTASWREGNLGVRADIWAHCPTKFRNSLAGDFLTENNPTNIAFKGTNWAYGYWNAQYGQGEFALVTKAGDYIDVSVTDPFIKPVSDFGPVPQQVALAMIFAKLS